MVKKAGANTILKAASKHLLKMLKLLLVMEPIQVCSDILGYRMIKGL